ncbi:hypothetical protein [Ancylobacter sp. IITR112]|uniref:hypothetical protein n=1 Tax=Ancylobacter sp. IITR112 TaxID=3138073 RepID=UPI00352B420F
MRAADLIRMPLVSPYSGIGEASCPASARREAVEAPSFVACNNKSSAAARETAAAIRRPKPATSVSVRVLAATTLRQRAEEVRRLGHENIMSFAPDLMDPQGDEPPPAEVWGHFVPGGS